MRIFFSDLGNPPPYSPTEPAPQALGLQSTGSNMGPTQAPPPGYSPAALNGNPGYGYDQPINMQYGGYPMAYPQGHGQFVNSSTFNNVVVGIFFFKYEYHFRGFFHLLFIGIFVNTTQLLPAPGVITDVSNTTLH